MQHDSKLGKAARQAYSERDRFNSLISEWFANRALLTKGGSDKVMAEALDQDRALACEIACTPSPYPEALFYKLEILKVNMSDRYVDHRAIILLAGVESDLRRFSISDLRMD